MITNLEYKPLIQLLLLLTILLLAANNLFGQNYETTEIKFMGGSGIPEDELIDLIHSEEGDEFDARLVKLDKILLTNYYRQNGFLTVLVFDSLTIDNKSRNVIILYEIIEGQRYYFERVDLTGNNIFNKSKLLNMFSELQRGMPFNEGAVKDARVAIENAYYNNGKPFVSIALDYQFEQDSMVVITCDIEENQTVTIKEMAYLGLKGVQEFIVRRELEIKKGEVYDREKITKSQRNLYRTGLFEYIRFELKPTAEDSSEAILQIQIQEKDVWWLGASIGFTSENEESYGNKLELSLEGGHRNLWGTGRSISLYVVPSIAYDVNSKSIINPDNHITFVFVEPWIGYTRTPGVFMASYHLYRPQNSADFNLLRFNFGVSREISDILDLRGSLEAKLVTTLEEGAIDSTLLEDASRDQVYSATIYGKRDTRNNFFSPTDGAFTDLSVAFSYSIGKDENDQKDYKTYITLISGWRRFQPLRWNIFKRRDPITLATRLRGGTIIELGPTKEIPISDLFFAGGATTVRGYAEQLLGPAILDDKGYKEQATGGKLLLLANAELRVPLFWLFVGEIFFDMGNVWQEVGDFQVKEIKATTGLGVAILTPVGPIRFDYGIKLNPDSSDRQRDAFHFGLYFAF